MNALCLALSITGGTIALISVFAVLPRRTEILDFVLGQLLGWLGGVVGFLAERRSKEILAREIAKINLRSSAKYLPPIQGNSPRLSVSSGGQYEEL